MWIILILQSLASAFNAIMDKHQFHYERSIFAYWAKKRTAWGDFWANFSGPESWRNKYEGFGIAWIDLLWRTAFVFVTDLWHAAQFGHFTAYQVGFALCLNEIGAMLWQGSTLLNVITWVFVLKALHGLVFNPLFYWLLDNPAQKSKTMETNRNSIHQIIAVALFALGFITFISAGQMSPVIFALAWLASVAAAGYLLFAIDLRMKDGIPLQLKTGLAAVLFIYFMGGLAETLTGFAIPDYVYHTIPEVDVPWIGTVITILFVLCVGAGILFRKQIGKLIYA